MYAQIITELVPRPPLMVTFAQAVSNRRDHGLRRVGLRYRRRMPFSKPRAEQLFITTTDKRGLQQRPLPTTYCISVGLQMHVAVQRLESGDNRPIKSPWFASAGWSFEILLAFDV